MFNSYANICFPSSDFFEEYSTNCDLSVLKKCKFKITKMPLFVVFVDSCYNLACYENVGGAVA